MGKMLQTGYTSSRTNHVCAEYYDTHNYRDWFYDRLNNLCIQNAYDFHN